MPSLGKNFSRLKSYLKSVSERSDSEILEKLSLKIEVRFSETQRGTTLARCFSCVYVCVCACLLHEFPISTANNASFILTLARQMSWTEPHITCRSDAYHSMKADSLPRLSNNTFKSNP